MSARKIANELWAYANKLDLYAEDDRDYWPNLESIAEDLRELAKELENEEAK